MRKEALTVREQNSRVLAVGELSPSLPAEETAEAKLAAEIKREFDRYLEMKNTLRNATASRRRLRITRASN